MLLTHPSFQLFSASLTDTVLQGVMKESFFPNLAGDEDAKKVKLRIPDDTVPVALRWTTHPEFGFPRQPFKVWRRAPVYADADIRRVITNGNEAVNFSRPFYFGEEMFLVAITCTVQTGQSLILTPIGRDNVLMEAKQYTLSNNATILFKAPFIIGIQVEGFGTVTNLAGIALSAMLQKNDWELVQIVGLPFNTGDVGGQGYDGDKQGFLPNLTDPESAARLRLKLGQWLFLPPPSINALDAQCVDPQWRHPNAEPYLKYLHAEQLKLVRRCLENSNDSSYIRENRQPCYKEDYTIEGMHQTGTSATQSANLKIPVVGLTMVTVSNESPASLGMGFGTYDFPSGKFSRPGVDDYKTMYSARARAATTKNFLSVDYMVTTQFVVRPFEEFQFDFLDSLSQKIEFAALNDERATPVQPHELEAMGIQYNRPEQRNQPYTQSVKLRWPKSNVPHGYGITASYQPGADSQVHNDDYPFEKFCYKNIFTPQPKVNDLQQDPADVDKYIINASEEPVPLFGSKLHKYFVGGWDVFGRWSAMSKINFTAAAPSMQQPGIMAIALKIKDGVDIYSLTPIQSPVPCQLEIEFSWDWIDRSPSRIEIAGKFFDASLNQPSAGVPNYFSLQATDTSTPVIAINFPVDDPTIVPNVPAPYQIFIMSSNAPTSGAAPMVGSSDIPSNNMVRYKLIVPVNCHFPGIDPFEVAFAAYIRGLEIVRLPINEFSDWNPWDIPFDVANRKKINYIARMSDPRPPAVTNFPATVIFTAIPDATKIGRGILSWTVAANATKYNVWEANETAIRTTLDKILKVEFPTDTARYLKPLSDPLVDRATQLRDLLEQSKYIDPCQKFFNRITKNPITTNRMEIALPGSADVMFLYQVSSVNSANIESGKSNVIFFAVPRVVKPASPLLQVRKYKKRSASDPDGEGFEIKVVNTIGEEPAGYQLYRVRKQLMSNDIGLKGLPVYDHTDAGWIDTTLELLDGNSYRSKKINELGIAKSWRPFVYQAVAVGKEDVSRGMLSGISEASTNEIIFFPPDVPPALLITGLPATNALCSRFTFSTSAPFEKISLGITTIEVFELDSNNVRTLIANFTAADILPQTAAVALALDAEQVLLLPKIARQETNQVSGITNFSICVKGNPIKIIVRITDPLNRYAEIMANS